MGKRLIGICSVAVTAIYTAGYIYTLPSAQAQASSVPPLSPTNTNTTPGAAAVAHSASTAAGSGHGASSSTSGKSGSAGSGTSGNGSSTRKNSSQSGKSSSKTPTAPVAKYKDGSYTGVGTNPYGSLALTVAIAHGKIASVHINQWTMHYPQSVIDPQLPQEVVSMQTWRIYIVTGATASTYNFAEAVYQALKKAKA